MIRVLFLCHGNICRSAAAEAIFLYLLKQRGIEKDFAVDSAALSDEEEGNRMYPPMEGELRYRGVPIPSHRAREVTKEDIVSSDWVFYMDKSNERILSYRGFLFPHVRPIFSLTPKFTSIDDPWYTHRFKEVVDQLFECLEDILDEYQRNPKKR